MLQLKLMNAADAREEYACCQELPPENGFDTNCYGVDYDTFVGEKLPRCMDMAEGIGLREGLVPQRYYFLWDDGKAVGVFKLRLCLNDALRNGAGHIGYGIRQGYRGKGYGTKGLALVLDKARDVIPEDEAYLSVNKANPASLKVMLNNGAYVHHDNEDHYFTRIKIR